MRVIRRESALGVHLCRLFLTRFRAEIRLEGSLPVRRTSIYVNNACNGVTPADDRISAGKVAADNRDNFSTRRNERERKDEWKCHTAGPRRSADE